METKKYKIGYTQGVFDMFHIGHLNLLNNAKKECEYLIVGINSDKLVGEYKDLVPTICESERMKIVQNIKAVDDAFIVDSLDKKEIFKNVKFDVIFIGDDWKGSERWNQTEEEMKKLGVEVIYLSHTGGISSTLLREKIESERK